ncbi:MAG: tetratricopeptide repeat protein [Bacteroidota bacterium]
MSRASIFIRLILLLLVPLLAEEARAQSVRDSLESRLETAVGLDRVEIHRLLVVELAWKDPQQAIQYAKALDGIADVNPTALQRADLHYGSGQAYLVQGMIDAARAQYGYLRQQAHLAENALIDAKADMLRGELYLNDGALEDAQTQFMKALTVLEAHEDAAGQAYVLHSLGKVSYRYGDLESALDLFADAMGFYERAGDFAGVGKIFLDVGIVYDLKGGFGEALGFYTDALELHEAHKDYVGAGLALCNIGIFYDLIGEKDEAVSYHNRSIEVCQQTGQAKCSADARANLASIRLEQRQRSEAISLYNASLDVYRTFGDQSSQARILNNLGQAYMENRDVSRALASYEDARALYEDLGEKEGLATVEIDAGQLYRRQAHYDEALESLQSGLAIAEEIQADPLKKKGYRELYLLHEGFGEYELALDAHKAFKAANDSLFNKENEAVLAALRTQFQSQEQQLKIQGLERDRAGQQRLILLMLLAFFLLLGLALFAYRLYRQKSVAHTNLQAVHHDLKSAQQKLIHSEKMASLGQLTAGVAHEIRNPLNFIINFSKLNVELSQELITEIHEGKEQKVEDVADKFESIIQDFSFNAQKVNEHSHRADGIVQSMLEHANATRQERLPTNINAFVQEIVELSFYGVKQTKHACDITVKQQLDAHIGDYELAPQELGRVLVNLIDNAIYAVCEKKKSPEHAAYQPEITIETVSRFGAVVIRLHDNGPGIPDEVTKKVFEPFYSTKPTGKGTGLGLSLAYDIVTMSYGGEMGVSSVPGKGTTFEIMLPRG